MKKIGIIICNYNKKYYVEKCLISLMQQTRDNFDICIVDNASTDGSVEYLKKYEENITLLVNNENQGGSGGFNLGIKFMLSKNKYEYLLLLDNDVILANDCIEQGIKILDCDKDIGMLGCEILKMDMPEIIQEFGPTIDYKNINFILNYGGQKDEGLPQCVECDYVPACAMFIRIEVIKKIGCMPQENFIYYDDITWGVRCKNAGYRICATSLAKAWHKGGAAVNTTTFPNYYLTRNKVKFFVENPNNLEDGLEEYADRILRDIYQGIFVCKLNGRYNTAKTRMLAFLDALYGVAGKAEEYKIMDSDVYKDNFKELIQGKSHIAIHMCGLWEQTRRIICRINDISNHKMIIDIYDEKYCNSKILGLPIRQQNKEKNSAEIDIYVCTHILNVDCYDDNIILVDGWQNIIANKDGYKKIIEFSKEFKEFKFLYKDMLVSKLKNYK